MVRGSILIFVVFYTVVFLRKLYRRHHWTGITIMLIGIIFVGWGGIRAAAGTEIEMNIPALLIIFGA